MRLSITSLIVVALTMSVSATSSCSEPSPTGSATPNNLRPIVRHITTYNLTDAKSVFVNGSSPPASTLPEDGTTWTLDYTTSSNPISYADNSDLAAYDNNVNSQNFTITQSVVGGTVIRHIDTPPGGITPLHRTLTLDYMILIEGEMELILDSGETRILKTGDTVVQRGTLHAWRNLSKTKWVRMISIVQESEAVEINGEKLGEVYLPPPVVE